MILLCTSLLVGAYWEHLGTFWIEAVKEIAPRQVMIYTIDRETPDHDLQKATHEELDRIVALLEKEGIPATASY